MDAAALAEFKEEGVVIVRGLIPSQQIDDWRAQVWDTRPDILPELSRRRDRNVSLLPR